MAKVDVTSPKLTRWDKQQKVFYEKFTTLKDGLTHSFDYFAQIHKQTLSSPSDFFEKVSKSQEPERSVLLEIINTCEDEERRREAYERLKELDHILQEFNETHTEFLQSEGDKANKRGEYVVLALLAAGGFIGLNNKQVRQFLATTSKSLLQIK